MLKSTLSAFRNDDDEEQRLSATSTNNNNDDDDGGGGLLIVNVDANAVEYRMLKEVAKTGILCDYISRGNHVIMLIQVHPSSWFVNSTDYDVNFEGYEDSRRLLTLCGVKFEDINDWM